MRTLRIFSLNFPIHHRALLTTVIMLYIIFQRLYLVTGSLYLLITLLWFALLPNPTSDNHKLDLFFYEFDGSFLVCFCFRFHNRRTIIQYLSFSVSLILLSIMPSKSIHIVTNGSTFPFLWWVIIHIGLSRWQSGKESTCQCRRQRFSPWVRTVPWSRKWQPTPISLPGKFHGQRSLVGYCPWGHKESDMTERLSMHAIIHTIYVSTTSLSTQLVVNT